MFAQQSIFKIKVKRWVKEEQGLRGPAATDKQADGRGTAEVRIWALSPADIRPTPGPEGAPAPTPERRQPWLRAQAATKTAHAASERG